jgi:hypothetical protein
MTCRAAFGLAALMTMAVPAVHTGSAADRGTQAAQDWRPFEGTWSVSGTRHALATEHGRDAAILRVSGAVTLTGAGGLGRGFHGEAIGFDDAATRRVGRWVWTDDRGDRIYGELSGEPMETGRRFTGALTGGSGRYTGIVGDFAFTWQYVVSPDSGTVAGRTTGLRGRFRYEKRASR